MNINGDLEIKMRAKHNYSVEALRVMLIAAMVFGIGFMIPARPQSQAGAGSGAKLFLTPDQAAKALIEAAENYNVSELMEILGRDGKDLVASEDPVTDKNKSVEFAALARDKQSITRDPKDRHIAILSVGHDDWPLPIPIVERNGKWYFDSKRGHDEILLRRIGENEIDAIEVCRGFVEAQHEYAAEKHDGSEVNQYAQRIISTPGMHDGLAWRNSDETWGGPVGAAVAEALAQGYSTNGKPFHGYYFKVLKGQGPAAPLGQMDFVVNGAMIGGFALAATPAQYRVTGAKTFVVSYQGVVLEKDLGTGGLAAFNAMERYNPDSSWLRTSE